MRLTPPLKAIDALCVISITLPESKYGAPPLPPDLYSSALDVPMIPKVKKLMCPLGFESPRRPPRGATLEALVASTDHDDLFV